MGNNFDFNFKKTFKLEERKKKFEDIKKMYQSHIPIICEKDPRCTLKEIPKSKYLYSSGASGAEFMNQIRKKLELVPDKGLFLLANGKYLIPLNKYLYEIYEKYKDPEDGFLYIIYTEEQFLGNNIHI